MHYTKITIFLIPGVGHLPPNGCEGGRTFFRLVSPRDREFAHSFQKNANVQVYSRGGWLLMELTDAY